MAAGNLDKHYIKFADIRDAEKATTWLSSLGHNWKAQYVSPIESVSKAIPNNPSHSLSVYEGQVVVTATFARAPRHIEVDATGKFISELVSDYGDVMAFEVRPGQALEVSYHLEFCDLRAAEKALADLNELKFDVNLFPPPPDTCRKLTHADIHLEHRPLQNRSQRRSATFIQIHWPFNDPPRIRFE